MIKRTLVFEPEISGHHLEYLNHIYTGAGEKANEEFIFIVHPEFRKYKDYLSWPDFKNVRIDTIGTDQLTGKEGNKYFSAFRRNQLLRKFISVYNPSHVFLITLMHFMPFLPLFLSRRLKVSGIIYNIWLRSYKHDSRLKRVLDTLKYLILVNFRIFDRIYILADPASARLLNRIYKTSRFRYLPDPFMPVTPNNVMDIRQKLEIDPGNKIFLHFGSLSERKGTLDILEALEDIKASELSKATFIFAGNLNYDIETVFRKKADALANKVQIKVYEGFCRYEFLGDLCSVSDYLLLPYRYCSSSSGLLGFAAQYNVPVIGPDKGLLGALIRAYKLGCVYNVNDPLKLSPVLEKHINDPSIKIDGRRYLRENNIINFQNKIFE